MSENKMQGLYMISGVEDITGNTLKDFYNNNKLLVWGTGLVLAGLAYKTLSKPTKKKK